MGAAVLDLLPDNRPASSLAVELQTNATSVPAWLADFDRWLGRGTHLLGGGATALLVGLGLAIGLASLGNGTLRSLAIWSGIMLAGLFWAAGQSFGQLFSGQATDPGAGPLVMLLGLAALSARSPGPRRRGPGQARTPSYGCRQAHDGPSLGVREATPAGDESQVNRPVATTLPDPSTTLTARTVVAATGRAATQEPYPSARENRPTTRRVPSSRTIEQVTVPASGASWSVMTSHPRSPVDASTTVPSVPRVECRGAVRKAGRWSRPL